jgi:23S rRNA pseudouridine955/2504/2580 synthase
MQEIAVPSAESGKKLVTFLKKQFPIGYVRKLFRKNGVRLNGQRAKPDNPIRMGDRVQLYIPFEVQAIHASATVTAPPIDIIFEDDSLLMVNKPAGMAVHEGRTIRKRESLFGVLEAKYRDTGWRPILVHRLDKDTSGLLLVAKNEKTADELEACFETGKIDKEYLCLVAGRLPTNEGKIDFPLPGREGNPVRAITRFKVDRRFSTTTLIRAWIDTGRLHQIRLHFAKLGYPVVMDDQHGDFAFNKRFRKEHGLKRQFLHAARLTLDFQGKRRQWSAPLPQDLAQTVKSLGQSERRTSTGQP